jgi:hypothetical protein
MTIGLVRSSGDGCSSGLERRRHARGRAATVAVLLVGAIMASPSAANAKPEVIEEQGFVAFCTGEANGYSVTVDLYQNTTVQVAPTVTIQAGDQLIFGTGTTSRDIFNDGTVEVDFNLVDAGTELPAGSATVAGTYFLAGEPQRVHEVRRDDNYVVVVTGTNTQLETNLTLYYEGTSIPLTCEPAFAFDLTTRRQRIGSG